MHSFKVAGSMHTNKPVFCDISFHQVVCVVMIKCVCACVLVPNYPYNAIVHHSRKLRRIE